MTRIFQVDAFTDQLFGGNPAAVVPLNQWLDDKTLQSIAMENNLAETAFTVPTENGYELRWFTPASEVALCGHATLATAYVLFTHLDCSDSSINFFTRQSGTLTVDNLSDGQLAMSFPSIPVSKNADIEKVTAALGVKPTALYSGHYSASEFDYVAVLDTQQQVLEVKPVLAAFPTLTSRGVIVTSAGNDCDFVSRYFAPNFGIEEDPVTGSAHCLLAPYWAGILGKDKMQAKQISARGGILGCRVAGDRTVLTGGCVDYLQGEISL